MSAIDNAFIRAYSVDAGPSGAAATVARQRAPSAASMAAASGDKSVRTSGRPAAANQPTTPGKPHFARVVPRMNPESAVIPAPHISLASFTHSASTLDTARPQPSIPVRIDPPATARQAPHMFPTGIVPPKKPAPIATNIPATRSISSLDAEQPSRQNPESLPAFSPRLAERPRAAYEVDRFSWPETCEALNARAGREADELAHELMAEAALGRKVVAISGASLGEGQTTLGLLLARRLAIAGAKVVLVDAHFASPQVAATLGLVVGIGWETVLAMPEKTSLWETMVESLEDRVTIVPLASRSRLQMNPQIAARLSGCLNELRDSFDVVLVDAGPLSDSEQQMSWLAVRGNGLDAVILLSDTRSAGAHSLTTVSRRFADASIAPLGVAENFCA